ncbi:MAG: nucleotidyltransferase domain-containing protein [bacterium]
MNNDIAQVIKQTAAVLKALGAKKVYIFGSAAKGTIKEGSDVDFAVVGLPPQEFFKALSAAGRISPRPLGLIDLDEVTPFTRYLKEEGGLRRVA